jgi:hypothetical protein
MTSRLAVLFALTCVACTPSDIRQTDTGSPVATSATDRTAAIRAVPVPLSPNEPTRTAIGAFTYAGGVELTGIRTTRLHGLSDLRVEPDGRFVAISDEADVVEGRIVLDGNGRPQGITDARFSRLTDQGGKPLQDKGEADAEGLAIFANGDRIVSFERDHRIWLYPAGGGNPRAVPKPDVPLPLNEGIEALTTYPSAGAGAYLVGSEDGRLWLCQLAGGCQEGPARALPADGFGLAGAASFGDDAVALLYRVYDPARGVRISLRLVDHPMAATGRMIDELQIMAPMTRDNFESVAVVARDGGVVRFYLLSDDNFARTQHTYLMAFDWKP